MANLYLALVHYPVLNRHGEVVASAITTIDLHDLGRTARTYDLPACYVVTPLADQIDLAKRLIAHWTEGVGGQLHPTRKQALELLVLVRSIEEAVADIRKREDRSPEIWATSARLKSSPKLLGYRQAGTRLKEGSEPVLLLLGTAWGLAPELFERAHRILEPIRANSSYNHLSVRCAAAIMVDRLLGDNDRYEGTEDDSHGH
ncbi:RNA methyltransferase [Thermodesulforhabdus norvegica]|uniref:tRNA (guanine-N(1)-)-methyltransferase C-terminal domain-containing protein n=1 Tax=Thermodesulforhabdus norvegica TaxID=39841 RepID=A0A1I4QYS7_9BACT|nr:RNA methyltransferase [Thermodesulforhabdus norvegica]SFM45179.1 hypothetical protein SAMN05660836_00301 [Thermodesulforhabdus norvegica]